MRIHPFPSALLLLDIAVPALPGPGASPPPVREIKMRKCVEPVRHWVINGATVTLPAASGATLHPTGALPTE
jgi:hypothetical protein